jgi:beta-galactosidase/beta-glucuronidase
MTTCDKMGIMVWHDFMFACGYYPDLINNISKYITISLRFPNCIYK